MFSRSCVCRVATSFLCCSVRRGNPRRRQSMICVASFQLHAYTIVRLSCCDSFLCCSVRRGNPRRRQSMICVASFQLHVFAIVRLSCCQIVFFVAAYGGETLDDVSYLRWLVSNTWFNDRAFVVLRSRFFVAAQGGETLENVNDLRWLVSTTCFHDRAFVVLRRRFFVAA